MSKVHSIWGGLASDMQVWGTVVGAASCDGAGNFTIELNGNSLQFAFPTGTPSADTYRWLGPFKFTQIDDISASYRFIQIGGLQIWASRVDATNFKLQLKTSGGTDLGTGSTNFPWGVHDTWIRLQADGTTAILEAGTTSTVTTEVTAATSSTFTEGTQPLYGDTTLTSAGKYIKWLGPCPITSSTTTDERPGVLDCQRLAASDVGEQYTQYTATSAGDVDDWSTGAADNSTTVDLGAHAGASTLRQTYDTSDITQSNTRAAAVYSWGAQSSASKTCTVYHIQADGTTAVESASVTTWNSAGYGAARNIFNTDENGGTTWDFTNYEIGVRTDSSNTLNAFLSAIQGEALGYAYDPVPAAGGRRRVSVTYS